MNIRRKITGLFVAVMAVTVFQNDTLLVYAMGNDISTEEVVISSENVDVINEELIIEEAHMVIPEENSNNYSEGQNTVMLGERNDIGSGIHRDFFDDVSEDIDSSDKTVNLLNNSELKVLKGSGTKSDPYQIEDEDQLNSIRNDLTASYVLTNDIDLNISDGSQMLYGSLHSFLYML